MEFLETYQYLFVFIGLITTILLTAPILYFTIKDKNPSIKTKVIIEELPKIQDTLTGEKITFQLKQKTNTISYIQNPKVYIRVLYNFSKFLACKDVEITDKLIKIKGDSIIILEKMGQIYELEYKYGKTFIKYIQNEIDGEDVLNLKLYIKYYDKSNNIYSVTNRNVLNGYIFKYTNNKSIDVSRMLEIIKRVEGKDN